MRALDLVEEVGGGDRLEVAKELLHLIDKEVVEWASMGETVAFVTLWTVFRTVSLQSRGCDPPCLDIQICAAYGGGNSQDEKICKAATKLMALLEKDGNHPGGPNFSQTGGVRNEVVALLGSDGGEVGSSIAQSLAIPTAVDEPGEMPPPEPLNRQDNG